MHKTQSDIKKLGTILCVWAHPDDETFCAGGILATAVSNGQKVICITATKGEAGSQDVVRWPADKLGDVRAQELAKACKILGIDVHIWLDCYDGDCVNSDSDKQKKVIAEAINKHQPDTVLTFGPDGLTGHEDHAVVGRWASQCVEELSDQTKPTVYFVVHAHKQHREYLQQMDKKINMYFNIDQPSITKEENCDIYYELPSDIIEQKLNALKAMPSQTEMMFDLLGEDFLRGALGVEAFVKKPTA